jgi:hypothetical protein
VIRVAAAIDARMMSTTAGIPMGRPSMGGEEEPGGRGVVAMRGAEGGRGGGGRIGKVAAIVVY